MMDDLVCLTYTRAVLTSIAFDVKGGYPFSTAIIFAIVRVFERCQSSQQLDNETLLAMKQQLVLVCTKHILRAAEVLDMEIEMSDLWNSRDPQLAMLMEQALLEC